MTGRRFLTMVMRAALGALLALAATGPAHATQGSSPHPCTFSSEQSENPFLLLVSPERFDCTHRSGGVNFRYTYGLISGLDLLTDPSDPWELRHEYSQAHRQSVYVRYADGALVKAPSDRTSARRLFSPGLVAYTLPDRPGRIVAALIVIEGLQNQRGVAPGLDFKTSRAAIDADLPVLAMYGLLAGAVIALFGYNLALYGVLRYPFILTYCLTTLAMLGTGLSWSGGIFLLLPDLDTTTQISLTMLFTSLVLATTSQFLINFVEPEYVPRSLRTVLLAVATTGIVSSIIRLVDYRFAWMTVDRITYGCIALTLVTMLAAAGVAAWRGSRSAKVYLVAWTLPIVLATARVLWGVGLIGGQSTLIAMSPLIIMAAEALMAALAVTWRIGLLRAERDALRHFAEIDSMTGLLNRRTFIARVQSVGSDGVARRLIIVDIDQFKRVNDRYGHQAGDDVLVRVARTLARNAPEGAVVGRIGGEEFGVLVPVEPVDATADRLCRAVAHSGDHDDIAVTISAGIADGPCGSEADWRKLYYAADEALYRAKHGGRNRAIHAPKLSAAA